MNYLITQIYLLSLSLVLPEGLARSAWTRNVVHVDLEAGEADIGSRLRKRDVSETDTPKHKRTIPSSQVKASLRQRPPQHLTQSASSKDGALNFQLDE